jgi:disease resistance protein RPM1
MLLSPKQASRTTMAEAVVGVLTSKLGVALAKGAAAYGASLDFKQASTLNDF